MTDGWADSAAAWIADMAAQGDFSRRFVLDAPMLALASNRPRHRALDVGCGEGRFCRMLRAADIATIGIDPTEALLDEARRRDPGGDYRHGRAEVLEFADASFDLVVSYLTLIDIPDIDRAIPEMARVLAPGGTLLIANMNGFATAGPPEGWTRDAVGERRFFIDRYLEPRAEWVAWRGIRIRNWHRPFGAYMALLLAQGLQLRHFSEPEPSGGDPDTVARYRRVPWFHVMAWEKPGVG